MYVLDLLWYPTWLLVYLQGLAGLLAISMWQLLLSFCMLASIRTTSSHLVIVVLPQLANRKRSGPIHSFNNIFLHSIEV